MHEQLDLGIHKKRDYFILVTGHGVRGNIELRYYSTDFKAIIWGISLFSVSEYSKSSSALI